MEYTVYPEKYNYQYDWNSTQHHTALPPFQSTQGYPHPNDDQLMFPQAMSRTIYSSSMHCLRRYVYHVSMLDGTTSVLAVLSNISHLLTSTQEIHQHNTHSSSTGTFFVNYSQLNGHKNSSNYMHQNLEQTRLPLLLPPVFCIFPLCSP